MTRTSDVGAQVSADTEPTSEVMTPDAEAIPDGIDEAALAAEAASSSTSPKMSR